MTSQRPPGHGAALARALVAVSLSLSAGCSTAPPPTPAFAPSTPPSNAPEAAAGAPSDAAVACDLVCQGAQVRGTGHTPDLHAKAVANANEVLASMHDDLVACYRARVAVSPKAHGFLTVDIIVQENGAVSRVETTGGAPLGEATMRCIVDRIKRGKFAPVDGGGTRHIFVPYGFQRLGPDETT